LRRSERIAAQPREADTTKQAQRVFWEPLSDSTHDALQLLLGGEFDPVAMELNMIGLDEEDN
jgi:hypothetical protein